MNNKTLSTLTLALAASATGNIMAQNVPVDILVKVQQAHPGSVTTKATGQFSRDALKAELLIAQRTGDFIANGETGAKLNEILPSRYAHKSSAQDCRLQVSTRTCDQRPFRT